MKIGTYVNIRISGYFAQKSQNIYYLQFYCIENNRPKNGKL